MIPSTASRSPSPWPGRNYGGQYPGNDAGMILPGTGRGTGVAGGGAATLAPGSMVLEENGYQMLRLSAVVMMKALERAARGLTAPLHRFAVPLRVAGEEL